MLCLLLLSCQTETGEKVYSSPETGITIPPIDTDPPDTDPTDPCTTDAPAPPAPIYPDTLGTLTVAVRTGSGTYDDTDSNSLSVCLTATDCFVIEAADIDDYEAGALDVYTFEEVGLARDLIDRVEIRSENGDDAWTPTCLELRFDGEPVYCEDSIGVTFGDGSSSEVESWVDPSGLHQACQTCADAVLTHGPMLGEVGPDHAKVLVRTDATREVRLRVGQQPDMSDARIAAWAWPEASRDFTAVLEATCLEPDQDYYYDVVVEGAQMVLPQPLRTAPPDGSPVQMRLAFGSCTYNDDQPIFSLIDELDPTLFAFVGDNHYGNTSDLESLRWNYRWALERPERAELLQHTPTLATWDDHDYVGNDTNGYADGKEVALRVFEEYWANPSFGTDETPGVFFQYRYGDIDFFFLDDRYYRGFEDSVLGAAQTAWLTDALLQSDATFKLLICGSQWTETGGSDSWDDYLEARNALFESFQSAGVSGVVLLSGDVHRSELRLIDRGADYALPEFVSSPLANWNTSCGSDDELQACYDDGNAFITLDIDSLSPEPSITATMWAESGASLATWTILLSELGG